MKYCKKCRLPKPARSHHCSVCNKCVLKMDHHCPWIANCVGHHNHRYFFLFLCYMSFTCYYYALASWPAFYSAINTSVTDTTIWPKPAFRSLMAFSWVLATIIGLAIVGLCWWQLFLVRTGLTTIDYYQWRDAVDAGKEHNMVVENFWDLGGWRQNFSWFFYVGKAQ
ncbi:DHHC palmitoyltransferase-domain-containing protein [Hyaloraphidium curvatum]|nr:DHHC palmitoyltransferase-domain-containing protein [Hyaloraphidium curvatum]